MDVSAAIAGRSSIRAYKSTAVEDGKLRQVLEAGRLAPSASNRQQWKFIAVTRPELKKQLVAAAFGQKFLDEAPAVIVACATEAAQTMPCGHPTYAVDVSIAMSFMVLQAYELGLGTCWLGAFSETEVKKVLGIPPEVRVVAMTPLGYPAETGGNKVRKSFAQVVAFESYK